MTAHHSLKTWPVYFHAVASGAKPFELRWNDRGFCVGDVLELLEFDPVTERFTGLALRRRVTYVLRGFGLTEGYVALGLVVELPISPDDEMGRKLANDWRVLALTTRVCELEAKLVRVRERIARNHVHTSDQLRALLEEP